MNKQEWGKKAEVKFNLTSKTEKKKNYNPLSHRNKTNLL